MGEFQKRIKKLLNAEHVMSDEDALNFVGAKFGKDREMLQDIIMVLEEAKKEFPKTSPELEKKYPETWESELNSLRLQWYKKWLADSE